MTLVGLYVVLPPPGAIKKRRGYREETHVYLPWLAAYEKKKRKTRDIRRKAMHGARYLSSVSVRCTYTYLSTYLYICMKAALLYCLRRREEANEKYWTVMACIYIYI